MEIESKYPDYDIETIKLMIANLYYELDDKKLSVKYYLAAYNYDTSNIHAISNLFSLFYENGDLVNALKFGDKYLKMNKNRIKDIEFMNLLESIRLDVLGLKKL